MKKVGRPRALSEPKRREVCALIATGCGIAEAAKFVGCSVRTIRREALRNEDFHETLRRSELSSQLDPIRTLRKAANTHWRAAAWLLERTNPERFGRQDTQTIKIEQLDDIISQLVEMLVEEIQDPETQKRIYMRLLTVTNQIMQESFATNRPRRDPQRALRMLGG